MSEINEAAIQTKAELLFPAHLISSLRDLRGPEWEALVDRVTELSETDPDSLAFVLMMIELDGCMKCNSNNFKFLRGCFLCATQTVQSFKGSDKELLKMYAKAQKKIEKELSKGIQPGQLKVTVA
ncbi:MAG: hypothetical protein AAF702_35795 [Chloroflexota bacterium]